MLTDTQTIMYESQDLLNILAEIQNILDTAEYDDVAWLGDFNWDRSRGSGFSSIMKQFATKLALFDVW